MNKAACKMCKYVYTDDEIFREGNVSKSHMGMTCPKCGKYNIHKAEEFMDAADSVVASEG